VLLGGCDWEAVTGRLWLGGCGWAAVAGRMEQVTDVDIQMRLTGEQTADNQTTTAAATRTNYRNRLRLSMGQSRSRAEGWQING